MCKFTTHHWVKKTIALVDQAGGDSDDILWSRADIGACKQLVQLDYPFSEVMKRTMIFLYKLLGCYK
jgi:uncharacterized protein YceK